MIRTLLAALGRKEPTGAAATSAHAPGQKTILIIDDHPDSLRAMCLALSGEVYRVEMADTAMSATLKLSTFRPDLILLDPQVPATDGSKLVRHLLADEKLASVPVLALTEPGAGTGGDRKPVDRFDGTIRKPTDAGEFAGEVRAFLERSPRGAPQPPAVRQSWIFSPGPLWIRGALPRCWRQLTPGCRIRSSRPAPGPASTSLLLP